MAKHIATITRVPECAQVSNFQSLKEFLVISTEAIFIAAQTLTFIKR